MVTYRFKITFEDYDEVVREIDIKTSQTFKDLHYAIHRSTGYNAEKSSSFYVSTDNWLKGDEIAYLPSDRKVDRGVILMENAKLKNYIEDPHQKFYYTYDFERPYDFHVELIKIIIDADEGILYPALVKSRGEAPKIFDKNNPVTVSASTSSEFDFLNELNFVPEDAEVLESMSGHGVDESEKETDDDNDEFSDEEDDAGEYDTEAEEDY